MKWDALEDEPCSLARTVAVIGDRWSLLILRECFLRARRFDEFQTSLGITRHLLADRLKKLVRFGVLRRIPYQESPKRYEYLLTQKGLDLYPIIMSIVHWGDIHMVDSRGRPMLHEHKNCGHMFDPVMVCSECGNPPRCSRRLQRQRDKRSPCRGPAFPRSPRGCARHSQANQPPSRSAT